MIVLLFALPIARDTPVRFAVPMLILRVTLRGGRITQIDAPTRTVTRSIYRKSSAVPSPFLRRCSAAASAFRPGFKGSCRTTGPLGSALDFESPLRFTMSPHNFVPSNLPCRWLIERLLTQDTTDALCFVFLPSRLLRQVRIS